MPQPYETIGKWLILIGVVLLIIGAGIFLLSKLPLPGKLPGDISIKIGETKIFFPIVTCLVISIILTLILNIIFRILK